MTNGYVTDPSPDTIMVLADVADERVNQDTRWGEQTHSDERWLTILAEEFGECARGMLDGSTPEFLDEEIIQMIAVAVAWLECRRNR